ncbi:hypothetical protein ACFL7E_07635 [Thermodesulfobacteriota bacterium]
MVRVKIMHGKRWSAGFLPIVFLLMVLFVFNQSSEADDQPSDYIRSFVAYPNRMVSWDQASPETYKLLNRYKPRIHIAPGSYKPMNFYQDYLPDCRLRGVKKGAGNPAVEPTHRLLKQVQFDSNLYLDYRLTPEEALAVNIRDFRPTIYGRIYTDSLSEGDRTVTLVFLKYSLVYPFSGLPAEIGLLRRIGGSIIGNRKGWHELDIHGSIHVVLDGKVDKPVGLILAQHNHHRVLLAGRDFRWPEKDRVSISVAQYSNEPYLLPSGTSYRLAPATGNPMNVEFLFGKSERVPFNGGYDKIYSVEGGAVEIPTNLELLPLDDPLYTAWIPLGNRHKIFGLWETWYMRGPPGIDFYTFPELKNMADLMAFWLVEPSDKTFFSLMKEHVRSFSDYDLLPVLKYQKTRLLNALLLNPETLTDDTFALKRR